MMSRGRFVTLTGLLVIGGAQLALAQPEPTPTPAPRRTSPAPVIVVAPTPRPAPDVQSPDPWPSPRVPIESFDFDLPQPFVIDMPAFEVPHVEIAQPFEIPHVDVSDFEHVEFPHVEFPHVEFPHVEIPHVEIPHFEFEMPQIDKDQIEQAVKDAATAVKDLEMQVPIIDKVQIEKAVKDAKAAVKVLEKEPFFKDSFKWDDHEWALAKAERAREAGERVRKSVEMSRDDLDRVRDFAYMKMRPMPVAVAELHSRFGQAQTAQIARMFERCENWRGNNSDEAEDRYYDCGRRAVDESQWDRAVDYFGRAAAVNGSRADGALYWKAWSQNRLGQRAEALTTLGQLKGTHGKSRWMNDASALEVEIRQRSGQAVSPDSAQDEEIVLLALNAMRDNPAAVPQLEKFLTGPKSPKLKERALFVIAQNQNPAARAILARVAKGEANPELQLKAVQYLGQFKSPETREILSQAYKSSGDATVKRAILRSYSNAQDRERLLDAARTETDANLRLEAVRQLGNMQATTELVELYGRESTAEVKKQILRSLANSGQTDRLAAIAQAEQDPELKRTAIKALGLNRNAQTGTQLVDMYTRDQTRVVREAVIDALFVQGNGAALVGLARKEKDMELRRILVQKLSNMRDNPEAEGYMLELLK